MKSLVNGNEIYLEGNTLSLKGPLNQRSVMSVWAQTKALLSQHSSMLVDLSGVTQCDSASVALLLEWLRQANTEKRSLSFTRLPKQMMEIIKVNNLSALLPISEK